MLTVAVAFTTVFLVFKRSSHQNPPQVETKPAGRAPTGYKSKREIRNALSDGFPLQLQKFRDGIMTKKYDPKKLSQTLSSIQGISQRQANAIIDYVGEDRLASYLENLPKEIRNDDANNQMLYLLLVDRLIDNNPVVGIDTIKRIKPIALFPGQYSNLLTKAALEPTDSLASKISEELLPHASWPIHIDGKLFENLVNSGLGINAAIGRLESLPGGKDLAAAAVVQHYLIDDTVVDLNTPDGKDLLAYIEHADNMSLYSRALIAKLTSNDKKFSNNEQKIAAPEPDN